MNQGFIEFIFERFKSAGSRDAVIWGEKVVSYSDLLQTCEKVGEDLRRMGIGSGAVVALEADFSPLSVATLLGLIEVGAIVVPRASQIPTATLETYRKIAGAQFHLRVTPEQRLEMSLIGNRESHPLIEKLRQRGRPGLVIFSSGSSGEPKAILHDFTLILNKFKRPRRPWRMLGFLLFDHIGGVNTLFYTLANAGCFVAVTDREPNAVMAIIGRYRVEALPASPTFLQLLLLSRAWEGRDLSCLSLITYGTEPMTDTTLRAIHAIFPNADLRQTYGMSELGILHSQSKASDSLWMRVGGEGFETRVVDGLLEIRAASSMLGYLNAPSPFTEDGWFKTGDAVEVDGEWIRVLGRNSDLINVGGRKVYPAEVENVLQTMTGVEDVAVAAEPNLILGSVVQARVRINTGESISDFRKRMRIYCQEKLLAFQIPQSVVFDPDLHSFRFKKRRPSPTEDR